jgi:GMP synthase (glutamine-hydrolysing)
MRVYVLQHAEHETPGMIADILGERGITEERVRSYAGDRVPTSMDGGSGLVVMGGPMAVYEQDRYPYLRDEIRLIRDAIDRGVPVLGICLGSQLIAAALGARVAPARREIGWHAVTLSDAAGEDPLWRGVSRTFEVFHWHGDAFELPTGSASLAASDRTPCQAFRHGRSTYGFLFHMEMSEAMVRAMVEAFGDDLAAAGESAAAVLARTPAGVRGMTPIGRTVFLRWTQLLREAE